MREKEKKEIPPKMDPGSILPIHTLQEMKDITRGINFASSASTENEGKEKNGECRQYVGEMCVCEDGQEIKGHHHNHSTFKRRAAPK